MEFGHKTMMPKLTKVTTNLFCFTQRPQFQMSGHRMADSTYLSELSEKTGSNCYGHVLRQNPQRELVHPLTTCLF